MIEIAKFINEFIIIRFFLIVLYFFHLFISFLGLCKKTKTKIVGKKHTLPHKFI